MEVTVSFKATPAEARLIYEAVEKMAYAMEEIQRDPSEEAPVRAQARAKEARLRDLLAKL